MSRRFVKGPLKPPPTKLPEKMKPLAELSGATYSVRTPIEGNSAKAGDI